jgi:peptide/nickel transport system substrate-binding protein
MKTRSGLHVVLAASAIAFLGLVQTPAPAQAQERIFKTADTIDKTVDPHGANAAALWIIALNLYDNLYRYEGNPPELKPWLATAYKVSPDGLTWEYTLRDGLKFHDGAPLTAEDVAYSFKRALAIRTSPAAPIRPFLPPDNITAPDAKTVRFVLTKPFAAFHQAAALISVVNSKLLKANEKDNDWGQAWLATNEAGSGAYKLVAGSYQAQENLDFEYNPDHFKGWGKNPIKRVNVKDFRELSTQTLAMMRGDLDMTNPRMTREQIDRLAGNENVQTYRDLTMRTTLLTLNNKKPPLDNVHVRRAISYSFNYNAVIEQVYGGASQRNPTPLPRQLWGFPEDVKGYDYDMAKAKAELEAAKKAGADLSRELEFAIPMDAPENHSVALVVQNSLRQLGLKVKIVPSTFVNIVHTTRTAATSPDIWSHQVSAYYIDPDNWVGQMYHSASHGTWQGSAWYQNPQVDDLLARARTTIDQKARADLYKQAVRQIVADAADVWVGDSYIMRAVNKRVTGYSFSPIGNGAEIQRLQWKN